MLAARAATAQPCIKLLLAAGPSLRGPLLADILAHARLQLAEVEVASASGSEQVACLPAAAYTAVVCASEAPLPSSYLSAVLRLLRPGGACTLLEPEAQPAEASHSALLLAGFTGIARAPAAPPGYAATSGAKPQWEVGAKAAISLKGRSAAAPQAPPAKAWVLDTGDDDLLDEDELLTEADKAPAAAPVSADDCEVGKAGRKACKNCSCGRAEAEAAGIKVQLTQEMLDNPQSACGSCGLGDAFRCASCPYRGLPTFQAGQRVTLPAHMLASDL